MNNVCNYYFRADLAANPSSIEVRANLLHDTPYQCVLIDKFGKRYLQEVTSDTHGYLMLDMTGFPAGVFTQYSGTFELLIYNAAAALITFTMCTVEYLGFSLAFYAGQGVAGSIVQSLCGIVSESTEEIAGYFKKAFNFTTTSYSIPATEHQLAQIFSIEVLVKQSGQWQNAGLTYDIDPDTQDITLHSEDASPDFLIVITGISA